MNYSIGSFKFLLALVAALMFAFGCEDRYATSPNDNEGGNDNGGNNGGGNTVTFYCPPACVAQTGANRPAHCFATEDACQGEDDNGDDGDNGGGNDDQHCTAGVDCDDDHGSCTYGGICTMATRSDCINVGGTFSFNTSCPGQTLTYYCPNASCVPQTGATRPANCFSTAAECQASTSPTDFTGGCCLGGFCYANQTQSACTAAGGVFSANDNTCGGTCRSNNTTYTYYCGTTCTPTTSTSATPSAGCYATVAACQAAIGGNPPSCTPNVNCPTDIINCQRGSSCSSTQRQLCTGSIVAICQSSNYCCWATDDYAAGGAVCIDMREQMPGDVQNVEQCLLNHGTPNTIGRITRLGTCGWEPGDPYSCHGVLQGQMNLDHPNMTQQEACQEFATWFPGDLDGSTCWASM